MRERGPFNDFIEAVNKILEIVQSGKPIKKDKLSADMEAALSLLERYGDLIAKLQKGNFEKFGIKQEKVDELVAAKDQLPEKEKQPLEQLENLKAHVETIQLELQKAERIAKQREKSRGKAGKAVQTRKKKFDRAGRRPDWKPL